MVLSLASLIPAPQADRSSVEGAPRRSSRGEDQARFDTMIEPAKPLPPQASPRAIETRSGDTRPERETKDQPVRPDPLRDHPRHAKSERAEPLRDAPRKAERKDTSGRSTAQEDRSTKAAAESEHAVYDGKTAKEQIDKKQVDVETTGPRIVDPAESKIEGEVKTEQVVDTAATPELSGEVLAAIETVVQTPTDLLTEALAALAQHLEAQIEAAKPGASTEQTSATTQSAALTEQSADAPDTAALQIAAGLPPVAATSSAVSTATATATQTAAPVIAQGQAASPQTTQSAMLAALSAEIAADGAGGAAETDETGAAGSGAQSVAAQPATAKPSPESASLVAPDFAAMIGSDAKATGASESKSETKATTAVTGATSGEAKAQASELLQPNVKSVPDTGPKAVFAEWMQDFAAAHGATHRSGDLMSSLDRLANGLPAQSGSQDVLRPTPLQMLPVEIGMQAMRGVTRFQIRLDPAELGRVDVKLEIRETGEVEASLVVDRVETLALLKRDANTLHQAFEQAGLKQSPDGLQFSLRGEGQKGEGRDDQRPRWPGQDKDEALPVQNQIAEIAMRRMMIPNSSIDRII